MYYDDNGFIRTTIPGNEVRDVPWPPVLYYDMGFIIAHCVQLESLELSMIFFAMCFERLMEEELESKPKWMESLRRIRVMFDVPREEWVPGVFYPVQAEMIFYLPNVETIELEHYDSRYPDYNQEDVESVAKEYWSFETPPVSEHLTTLRISSPSAEAPRLALILKQTPQLRIFELDCLQHPETWPFNLDRLKTGLDCVKATLTQLKIRYEVYFDAGYCENVQDLVNVISGSLGSFREFQALIHLEISLHVLFGSENSLNGVFFPLSAVLPPNLETLIIMDDLYMFNDFQGYFEDGDAMKIFKRFLTGEEWDGYTWVPGAGGGEWEEATPRLKRFVYDLRKRGEWGHERQGLKGEVLWED
jgi:hypothetical protein